MISRRVVVFSFLASALMTIGTGIGKATEPSCTSSSICSNLAAVLTTPAAPTLKCTNGCEFDNECQGITQAWQNSTCDTGDGVHECGFEYHYELHTGTSCSPESPCWHGMRWRYLNDSWCWDHINGTGDHSIHVCG